MVFLIFKCKLSKTENQPYFHGKFKPKKHLFSNFTTSAELTKQPFSNQTTFTFVSK